MPTPEELLQDDVKRWLKELGYNFIGSQYSKDSKPIDEKLLRDNLDKRGYTKEQIDIAVRELVDKTKNQVDTLYNINRNIYSLLRYGRQGLADKNGLKQTVHYIDWINVENNDFCFAEEVSVLRSDGNTRKRPDIVIFVNGIALGMFELKKSSVNVCEGIRQLLTNQKRENILNFFSTIQLLFAGNEAQGLYYGTTDTEQKYYLKWREYEKADDNLSVEIKHLHIGCDSLLKKSIISMCHKERFLSLIHDFVIFDAGRKMIARHNQYFANIACRKRICEGEGGIVWNTQGSGKSLIMVWLTKWIKENIDDSRVVIITDREELDEQIEGQFFDVNETIYRAKSCEDLRNELDKSDQSVICSLIHKYGHNAGKDADIEKYIQELTNGLDPSYKAKGNIIAFIDECHRTNSGKLHVAVKTLMPDAILIGFTGTPLLHADKKSTTGKKSSVETFGTYIHTYKFDEGVKDGVILDLYYEARDVDQALTSPDKIDAWFEEKTRELTESAKQKLKQSWNVLKKLYSSKQRLEKIAADIIFDMSTKPRLKTDRGTAMLVADSVYAACRYWEIFTNAGFTKCAVVTSYEPTTQSVRTATYSPTQESEEEYKKKIYDRMLGGRDQSTFEAEVKKQFIEVPAQMKLLIVVDKLLTGFDAPSATYLYIDKSMRDHDLFQAICRVNRPDGEDKDFGYIVDYKDLFRNVQSAVIDYTQGTFEDYDKEDVDGLIKTRYDESKSKMEGARKSLESLFSEVPVPCADTDYIIYFCAEEEDGICKSLRRDTMYSLVSTLSRSFANCCDRLVSDYSYLEEDVEDLRKTIYRYNEIKQMIKIASCDYIDLKSYEADMRFILDTYIRAEDSKVISSLGEMSLIELLLKGETTTPTDLIKDLPGDNNAKAEIIENNLRHEIVKKIDVNGVYYGKLSKMLEILILQRKAEAMSNEEYLRQVVELAQSILHPEENGTYPGEIKESEAKRALYDFFDGNIDLAIKLNNAIAMSCESGWKQNLQKQQKIKRAIYEELISYGYSTEQANNKTIEIFDTVERLEEYNG